MHCCYFSLLPSILTSQTYRHLMQKSSHDVLKAPINSNPPPSFSFLNSKIILGKAGPILSLFIYYLIGKEPLRQNSLVCKKDQVPGAAKAEPQISMQSTPASRAAHVLFAYIAQQFTTAFLNTALAWKSHNMELQGVVFQSRMEIGKGVCWGKERPPPTTLRNQFLPR